jgi:kanamycin kinase
MLALPAAVAEWLGDAELSETSGCSATQTFLVLRASQPRRCFLKVGAGGSLAAAAAMHGFLHGRGLAPAVLRFVSADRDCLVLAAAAGADGRAWLSEPGRLAAAFGRAVRRLHAVPAAECPCVAPVYRPAAFSQANLDRIAPFIGVADARAAGAELAAGAGALRADAVLHGDCCLPNLVLHEWEFSGFVDLGAGGVGDRHFDLAMALWSLSFNLGSTEWGAHFIDAYGRDAVDARRLRICGLMSAGRRLHECIVKGGICGQAETAAVQQ